jgi:hypothetical protein
MLWKKGALQNEDLQRAFLYSAYAETGLQGIAE